jgi:flagellar FliL protein
MADKAKEAAEEAAPAGGGKKKLVLLVGAVLFLALAGGGAAYMLGLFGGAKTEAAATPEAAHASEGEPAAGEAAAAGHEAPPAPEGPKVLFVDLPDVLVNLNSTDKRMRFLKLRLAVEVADKDTGDTVTELTPRIMDSFQLYLRGLTVDDLRGPAALYRIKQEMLARINLALDPKRIDDVLFKEMLVQ